MDLKSLTPVEKDLLQNHLNEFISEHKKERFSFVLNNRTRHFTVVLEDIYQERNAGAILRTADCYGIQDVHIIETKYQHKVTHSIAIGAEKWMTTHLYQPPEDIAVCIDRLKKEGYRIVATTPHNRSQTIHDIPVDRKAAIVLGAEKNGISDEVMALADEFLTIPIYGFSESFNVSVANALILHELTNRMKKEGVDWQLSEDEKKDLLLEWSLRSVKSGEMIARKFLDSL